MRKLSSVVVLRCLFWFPDKQCQHSKPHQSKRRRFRNGGSGKRERPIDELHLSILGKIAHRQTPFSVPGSAIENVEQTGSNGIDRFNAAIRFEDAGQHTGARVELVNVAVGSIVTERHIPTVIKEAGGIGLADPGLSSTLVCSRLRFSETNMSLAKPLFAGEPTRCRPTSTFVRDWMNESLTTAVKTVGGSAGSGMSVLIVNVRVASVIVCAEEILAMQSRTATQQKTVVLHNKPRGLEIHGCGTAR